MQRKSFINMQKAAISIVLTIGIAILAFAIPKALQIMPLDLTKAAIIATSISFMTPIPESEKSLDTVDTSPKVLLLNEPIPYEDIDGNKSDIDINIGETPQNTINIALPNELTDESKNITPVIAPIEKPANSGIVTKKFYQAGNTGDYINLNSGFLKNCSVKTPKEILDIAKLSPKFKIKTDKSPQVLIMHTHTTESYQTTNEWFIKGESCRTTDLSRNVVAVGDKIEAKLNAMNIGVIHDKTLHDYPSYNGSYERSAVTVKRILKENPSIKIVLDVHRDAIQPSANEIIAPTVKINGKSSAQVMIIAGCEKQDGSMGLPHYKENLKLACALQREMTKQYNGLARPILFDYRKYNQDLTTGSLLLEMGGHGNTLDEALYCGELVGKCLADTLTKLS